MTIPPQPSPLTAHETETLIAWAREAGQIALGYFKNVEAEYKADHTFLTQADREVEQFLVERLQATFPADQLIGEEGARSPDLAAAERIWAIDPIDGTTVFVQGLTGWGIALGLLCQGRPCFGLFYMPQLDDLTYIDPQGQVISNRHPLTAALRRDWSAKGYLATSSEAQHNFHLPVKRLRALGSISANLVYTARGSATATFSPKASLWDLVAGAAMLTRLGGELRYLSGQPVDYLALLDGQRTPEPVIAGHPEVVAELAAGIRAR